MSFSFAIPRSNGICRDGLSIKDVSTNVASLWVPFFLPRIQKRELIERIQKRSARTTKISVTLQKHGGEAFVDAVVARVKGKLSIFVRKEYYNVLDANFGYQLLRRLKLLSQSGRLSHFKVVDALSVIQSKLKTQLIEGQTLAHLVQHYPDHPALQSLVSLYTRSLYEAAYRLNEIGYPVEFDISPKTKLPDLLVYPKGQFEQRVLLFGITPENTQIEYSTGEMWILDGV